MNQKNLWKCKHPYYCTERQYFANQSEHQTVWEFKSFSDFLSEMGDADMDYNMLFRWDWSEEDSETGGQTFNGDPYYRNGKIKLFFMVQRKGFHSCSIVDVCRADEPAVIEYPKPRLAYLMSLWAPLGGCGGPPIMKITDDMLTEWISVGVPPMHFGWYEVRYEAGDFSMLWYDGFWRFQPGGGKTAFGNIMPEGEFYRGLKEKHHG